MAHLPSLTEVAEAAWKFTRNLNEYLQEENLGDTFRAAATPEEMAEWRLLGPSIQELQAQTSLLAAFSDEGATGGTANPLADYCSVQKIRMGEIYARVGIKALDIATVKDFFPAKARQNPDFVQAIEKLATLSLAKLCQL